MTRIVSYNVHACIGSDGRFDPARIAAILETLEPDFVALQEVEDRRYRGTRVSEFLAERLGLAAHYGSTLQRGDAPYGNLLLAGHPVAELRTHDISIPGGEPRGAIEAVCALGEARLRIVATHLGLGAAERRRQVRLLRPLLHVAGADITVLAGDINEWRPAAASVRALVREFDFHSRARSFPARLPLFALDRIFVSPAGLVREIRAVKTEACRQASDHLPIVCDLVSRPRPPR